MFSIKYGTSSFKKHFLDQICDLYPKQWKLQSSCVCQNSVKLRYLVQNCGTVKFQEFSKFQRKYFQSHYGFQCHIQILKVKLPKGFIHKIKNDQLFDYNIRILNVFFVNILMYNERSYIQLGFVICKNKVEDYFKSCI